MTPDPVFGVLTREKFQELVAAPFGEAAKAIRKVDPHWQREAPEVKTWRVICSRAIETREEGWADIEAATQEEAEEKAKSLSEGAVDWFGDIVGDYTPLGDFKVEEVLDEDDEP